MSTGRNDSRNASWAVRVFRFAERTAENVATARTSVPPAVASEEIVDQFVIEYRQATGQAPQARPGHTPIPARRRGRGVTRHDARHDGAAPPQERVDPDEESRWMTTT